ncbi:hypothetical protein ACS0TY_024275 [Phlomoides rotata]
MISTSENKRGKYTTDDLKEELSHCGDGERIPALLSSLSVQPDVEKAEVVGHETTDVSSTDDRSFDLEREKIAVGAPNRITCEEVKLVHLKKRKLSSLVGQLCQEYDNVEYSMAARSLETSKSWSGSSDQCTSPDEVLQDRAHRPAPEAGNIKRKVGSPCSEDRYDKEKGKVERQNRATKRS